MPALNHISLLSFWCSCWLSVSMHPSFASPNRDRSHKSIPLKLKCGRVVRSHFPYPVLSLCLACRTHFIYYYYRLLKQIMNLFGLCVCITLLPGFYSLPFYAIKSTSKCESAHLDLYDVCTLLVPTSEKTESIKCNYELVHELKTI